ncbi:MAG: transcription elongation factor GreA [Clostridia bacterium]|nr:transcription elongation factor GreA [Clostridia bacterium]
MAEQKTYTPAGFKALQDELDYLVNVRVEENKKEISTARAFGDLSENSEYDEAKQEQGKIHSRISELREMIANAIIIDESQIDEKTISVGSIVTVYNVERNMEVTYHIVGSYETDPKQGKISDSSPIGIALIGARAGDEVVVAGVREQHLRVLNVTRAKNA